MFVETINHSSWSSVGAKQIPGREICRSYGAALIVSAVSYKHYAPNGAMVKAIARLDILIEFLRKIFRPKLKNEQCPKFFVMRGFAGLVFADQSLNVFGVKKALVPQSFWREQVMQHRI